MKTDTTLVPAGHCAERSTYATVYLDRLTDNVRAIRSHLGTHVRLLAVVKADAFYGHGATLVARTALEAGAAWLGVACVDEGLALRQAGVSAPILVLGFWAEKQSSMLRHTQD